jgi:DNA-binding transcriptional ArsR family regulator
VIEVTLTPADLAKVRFAYSPVRELVASLRLLADRSRHHFYRGWLSGLGSGLRGVRWAWLAELVVAGSHPTGFLTPVPGAASVELSTELAAVEATPADVVRAGLESQWSGREMPQAVRHLYEDPATHLPEVVDEMRRYWKIACEPISARLRALCAADVSFRTEQFAVGGVAQVLADLHPSVSLSLDQLRLTDMRPGLRRLMLSGQGMLLIPCTFSWPTPSVYPGTQDADPLALAYPPRGLAVLQKPTVAGPATPLCRLIGPTRATVLASLALPATTTELASRLKLSAAAVNQHLKVLEASGLAAARRRGKQVLYQRTAVGNTLLTAKDKAG